MEFKDFFINTSDYELFNNLLGEGTFGKVYVARKKIDDEPHYVAKIINTEANFLGEDQRKFLCESLILYNLNHPLIVKFIGASFQSFSDPTKFEPTIITEYLPNGSLERILSKGNLSIKNKYIFLLGISNAMQYLHEQGIVHRDLKPANILIDSNNYPCICDFGLSRCFPHSLTKSFEMSFSDGLGTPKYMAPELLDEIDHFSPTIDVFSFGILAYEIITGIGAYSELGQITSMKLCDEVIKGYRPKFPEDIPQKMIDLISKCWSANTEERPSFAEIYETLSTDLSYFGQEVDEEVLKFIEKLSLIKNDKEKKIEKDQKQIRIDILEEENKRLKTELTQIKQKSCQNEDELNNPVAFYNLGNNYFHGNGVNKDYTKAFECYQKAADLGYASSFTRLGLLYYDGKGVEKDYNKAFKLFQKASDLNDPIAFYNLGNSYFYGNGVDQDYTKAIEYFQKAADLGYASSFTKLGLLYYDGKIVKQDYNKAFELFQKASDLNIPTAFYNLGNSYFYGNGVDQDYNKAIECYQKAADLGYASSFTQIDTFFSKDKIIKQDYSKAFELFQKATDLNILAAFYNLGNSYLYGNGVDQDFDKAIKYFQKAADYYYSNSIYKLGSLYETGIGTDQNPSLSIEYYQKAANLGNEEAKLKLIQLIGNRK